MEFQNDRRRHIRKKVPESILVDSEWNVIDLSESGMLVSSRREAAIGNRFQIKLKLVGETLDLSALVRRCIPSPSVFEAGFHIGLEFQDTKASETLRLRGYIDTLPPFDPAHE